jgi:hypothetical protein
VTPTGIPSGAGHAAYVSLTTIGVGGSTPILFASNPVGDALLSTGLLSLAGPTATSMVPLLPVRISGIDVRATLHRFDAAAHPPTTERGVTGANRVGEPLGALTMRWLVAPDGFEATASAPPPATELDAARSQRFVMHDAALRFEDRTGSGVRFFGAGRTYPSVVDGVRRLLFAGTAVVIEGLGMLKGLRGSVAVAGEISARSIVSLTIAGRFNGDGSFTVDERLAPLVESGTVRDATVLTLAGHSSVSAVGHLEERLSIAVVDNDVANATRPRSGFQLGEAVGSATGPLRFDPADRRCARRLLDGRRELVFADAAGRCIGTIIADNLEGTAFHDHQDGVPVYRVIAYGALSGGFGALEGAGGVLLMDAAVSASGGAPSVYTVWLSDARGRFRANDGQPAGARSNGAALPAVALQFDDTTAESLLPGDRAILEQAERALAAGVELQQVLTDREHDANYQERFDIVSDRSSHEESLGFFDVVSVRGNPMPVMGIVQESLYDRPKAGSAEMVRAQLQEFVLRYFLRVGHVGEPGEPPAQQLFFKLAATGRIGKFRKAERAAIVDLREVGATYDWIVLKADRLSFDLPFAPFGSGAPRLQLPLKESNYLVVGPTFVTNRDHPEPGVVADYGFGYALVPDSQGRFHTAMQTVRFRLMADGEIRARAVSVVNRPDRITAIDVDPIGWGVQLADLMTFRMASRVMSPMLAVTDRLPLRTHGLDPIAAYIWIANTLTGGMAEKHFGISKAELEKRMLLQHYRHHHEMLQRSLQVWRMVPDWTAHARLPDYCQAEVGC